MLQHLIKNKTAMLQHAPFSPSSRSTVTGLYYRTFQQIGEASCNFRSYAADTQRQLPQWQRRDMGKIIFG